MPSGHIILDDAFVSINGVDLSDHVKSVELPLAATMLDATVMGSGSTQLNKPGLLNWTITVRFLQDWAAGEVDATLYPLWANRSEFTIIVRPKKADVVGTTNPNYTGTGVIENYQPFGQQVGQLAEAPVTVRAASALTRATA